MTRKDAVLPALPACSFNFLGTVYSSLSLCMNGYVMPGTLQRCSPSSFATMAEAVSNGPRLAPFWADLVSDGLLSAAGCLPEVAGQQSRMSWGASGGGSSEVDALVRRYTATPDASSFSSTSYFVATWANMRFAQGTTSATCARYTFQLAIAVSSISGQTYVLMLFTRVPSVELPAAAFSGLLASSANLTAWSSMDGGAAMAASVLGSGSNAGTPGLRVYRVDNPQALIEGGAVTAMKHSACCR